jgi:hypothetical protein
MRGSTRSEAIDCDTDTDTDTDTGGERGQPGIGHKGKMPLLPTQTSRSSRDSPGGDVAQPLCGLPPPGIAELHSAWFLGSPSCTRHKNPKQSSLCSVRSFHGPRARARGVEMPPPCGGSIIL